MKCNLEEAWEKIETTSRWTAKRRAEFVVFCCSFDEIGIIHTAYSLSGIPEDFVDVCFQFIYKEIIASKLRADKIANGEPVDEELSFEDKVSRNIEAVALQYGLKPLW